MKLYLTLIAFFGMMLMVQLAQAADNASSIPVASDNTENFSATDCNLPIIIIDDDNYPNQPKKSAKKANSSVKKLSGRPIITDTITNQTAKSINYHLIEVEKYIRNT